MMLASSAAAQSASDVSGRGITGFFARWDQRALQAQENQPNWLTPVVTSTARLKEEFRYDMTWQSNDGGATTDNYGGSKGLTTLPFERLEVSINLPPYVAHSGSRQRDGFGDFSILTKFRILAANRKHGDYVVTAFLAASFPTGSYKNGSPHAIITPTIAAGKGMGDFVLEGTFGCDLPSAQTALLGRRMILNDALQYRRWGKFWPEVEVNSNFYNDGPNDGRKQVYITPGLSAGRFPIHKNLTLTLAAGTEIAVTEFHSAKYQTIFSVRLPF
ncbi:MAG TPA: transporter [Candidatus Acidoferrales bacterium]